MTEIACGDWVLSVDLDATRAAYATIEAGDPETCGCVYCRNFMAARHLAYPPAVLEFYAQLGVRADREAETSEAGEVQNDGRRYYSGWHHFVGRITTTGTGQFTVAPNFDVVFLHARSCAEPAFETPDSVVQVEFHTYLPWLLDEPAP